jgi:hypothetical protein
MSNLSFNSGRRGQGFALGIAVWLVVLILGAALVWWGFFGADRGTEQSPTSATATPGEGGLVPLTSPPGTSAPDAGTTPAPTTPSTEGEGTTEEEFGYGVQIHGVVGDPDYTMGQVESLGLGWVKQQVRWGHFEPNPGQMDWSGYDAVVDAANERGLKVMFSVVDAPAWSRTYTDDTPEGAPPDDLSLFVDFLGRLVDRYQGRIHAIEVWNEQNLDREWDTAEGVSPERYVEMLQMAYQAIKSRDPNIIVISGALSPTGVNGVDPNNPDRVTSMEDSTYLQRMVDQGFLNYCDCVGAHHNGYNIPPDVAWDQDYQDDTAQFRGFWDNPHPSWTFRSTLWMYHDIVSGMKPLCVTEFGWASADGLGGYPRGFEFAGDNTLEEQAEYIVQAYQLMREWGFVRLAFLWNLDFANKVHLDPSEDPYGSYSIIDRDGAPRPAFNAIQEMDKP